MVLARKHHEFKQKLSFKPFQKLAFLGFFVSLSYASIWTIWAIYINNFLQSKIYVGFFSAFLLLISFLSHFLLIPVIQKNDKTKIYSISIFLFAVFYLLLSINRNFYFFVIIAVMLTLLQVFRIASFGIIVKDKSRRNQLSNNEGLMYTFVNLAFVIGPLIAGALAALYGIRIVFVMCSLLMFFSFILFKFSNIKASHKKKRLDKNFRKNFVDFFKSRDRINAYLLGGGVNLWWSLIYLYIPLIILEHGYNTSVVGIFLFFIALPLIFFEYYFSNLAGKIGFKKMFVIGFSIPLIISVLCFFTSNIIIILILLIIASIGLSMLEATTEAYFFDMNKPKDILRFYSPYNTTIDVNSLIGRILPALILLVLPFKFVYILYAILMLIMVIISTRVKDYIEDL